MDENTKNYVDHALSVQLLSDIISEAEFNAQSGDTRLALQGRQTVAIARILLNILGVVPADEFDNSQPPVAEPVAEPPANPVGQTGDGTVVKSPDQLTGPAPAGENNAALGPDTTDAPANAGITPATDPAAVDVLSGAPVPDSSGEQQPAPADDQSALDLKSPDAPPPNEPTNNDNAGTTDTSVTGTTDTSGTSQDSNVTAPDSSNETGTAPNPDNGNFVSG